MGPREMSGRVLAGATMIVLISTSCGSGAGGSTTTAAPGTTDATATTTTTAAAPTGVAVYFLLEDLEDLPPGPFLVPREAGAGTDPAVTVVEALLAGPTNDEIAGTPSISTAIPAGLRSGLLPLGSGLVSCQHPLG